MSKHEPQSEGMNALEQSLNDHMEICRLKRKAKRLKAENARLKAEVERLRASSFMTAVPIDQYERVIKAGDAMADAAYAHCMCQDCEELRDQWRDAKEGKQP